MRDLRLPILLRLICVTVAHAQQPQPTATVPKLVRFSGSFRPANGQPVQPVESLTLTLYRDQTGGEVLWKEVQNVPVDADGHYAVLMGATRDEGMPLDLFASGEPRWLGAQFNRPGETEQPRVLLVSVPYALKASDAETLGGRPASAYLLAGARVGGDTALDGRPVPLTAAAAPGRSTKAIAPQNAGSPNYIGKFTNTDDLTDSALYEVNGNVGIFTTTPAISLDVRTGTLPQMGIAGTTDYLTFFASDKYGPAIYWDPAKDMRFGKGGTGLYNPFGFVEQMRIQSSTGNVGIGTLTPASKLDVAGDINFSGSILYQGTPVLQVPASMFGGNIGVGVGALQFNAGGFKNAAVGSGAMQHNSIGDNNTAIGDGALGSTTIACCNAALGSSALFSNTAGSGNIAAGQAALFSNTTGNSNIAIGTRAAFNVSGGNSNNIHIANQGSAGDSGIIRIGEPNTHSSFFVAGVRGVTTGHNDAVPVVIDSNGQLGTVSSSRRFKEDIEDMGAASRDLMRLRPVTYRYKEPFADGSKPIQYGLIAEEVAEVYPDLVARSKDGNIETVKYQVLDSMLLNEAQRQEIEMRRLEQQVTEQHQQIDEQNHQNQSLQERVAKLEAALASISGRIE